MANHGQEAMDMILFSQDSLKDMIHIVLMDVEMPILDVDHASLQIAYIRDFRQRKNFVRPRQKANFASIFP